MATLREIKETIRNKYAWSGGYPLYFVMGDGLPLSVNSARQNYRCIAMAMNGVGTAMDWTVIGIEINYEDDLVCAHSGEPIERAYPADERECDGETV